MTTADHSLPAKKHKNAALKAEGFATPRQDKNPQCARILPKRVLPIIFLPGIMGSNLRMSAERQKDLRQADNIAWRPDSLNGGNARQNSKSSPRDRQMRLDPKHTSVDIYNPSASSDVSGDGRHSNVKLDPILRSPLISDDPPTTENGRSALQKARERGWGEVYFGSYGYVLQIFEYSLNKIYSSTGVLSRPWHNVIGIDPKSWGADPRIPQQVLTEEELKKVANGCWFPTYAFGYNWLLSNGESARTIAARIEQVMKSLTDSGYECNEVIVVTHSMGGLVGRALIHPDFGDLKDKVLGIIHGVMPAIGAPAAYKRMRAGFEDEGMIHGVKASIGAKVAGNFGDEVTAVLANSPGGLQLLPSMSYGNGWLRVTHNGNNLESWPKQGDPYKEIYKVHDKWYSLFREEWINSAYEDSEKGGASFARTCLYLDKARDFHEAIKNTYHPNSYAHYGADKEQLSFGEVVWDIERSCSNIKNWKNWKILNDSRQGTLTLSNPNAVDVDNTASLPFNEEPSRNVKVNILAPNAPGDKTVPLTSADHQLKSEAFKGVFPQTGYDHQSSYNNLHAIASTLYGIVRIAQKAKWSSQKERR